MRELIYKDEAIDAADKIIERDTSGNNDVVNAMIAWSEYIRHLPSAQPERKTGRWIKMSDADGMYYCCSECGEELYRKWTFNREFDLFPKKESIDKTNYCPNCGASMTAETVEDKELTMEEFMYGQDMGNPEDGSL